MPCVACSDGPVKDGIKVLIDDFWSHGSDNMTEGAESKP